MRIACKSAFQKATVGLGNEDLQVLRIAVLVSWSRTEVQLAKAKNQKTHILYGDVVGIVCI